MHNVFQKRSRSRSQLWSKYNTMNRAAQSRMSQAGSRTHERHSGSPNFQNKRPAQKSARGQRIFDTMDKERLILNVEKRKGSYDTMILFYKSNIRKTNNVYYHIILRCVINSNNNLHCCVQVMAWCLSPLQWPLWRPSFWLRSTKRRGSPMGSSVWCKAEQRPAPCSANTRWSPKSPSLAVCQQAKRYSDQHSAMIFNTMLN